MKKKSLLQLAILLVIIPAFLVSCGGGEKGEKSGSPKSKAGISEISKMVDLAKDYKAQLKKIQEDAEKNPEDVQKLTKLAQEYAEKEKKFNEEFVKYVEGNSDKLLFPIEQDLYNEFFEIYPVQVNSAKDLEFVYTKVKVKPLKTPYPTKDNWIYLKFVDKDGNQTGSTLSVGVPHDTPEGQEYTWEPRLSVSQFEGAAKAVVISEEEFKSL
jgi:hypothetical protein